MERVELTKASARIIGLLALFSACSSEPSETPSSGGATNGGAIAAGGVQSGGLMSGGTVSSGAATASGGASTNGGTTASGGTTGSGGTTASGGTTGSGGTTASGGTIGSGGTTASGGKSSAGGVAGVGGSAATGGSSAGMPGGGASSGGAGGTNGGAGAGGGAAFTLTSPNHADGAKFASKYTCAEAGFDKSILPELDWTAGPPGTKSYAITFIDTTLAPANMNGYHWVAYDIPAAVQKLPEGLRDANTVGAKQSGAFLGPCPNFMASGALKTDNYEFTLYALATETTTFSGSSTAMVKDAQTKLEASHLASVKLKGTSDAKWPK